MSKEKKEEGSSISDILDAVKELTKTVAELSKTNAEQSKQIELSRKAGKFVFVLGLTALAAGATLIA